MGRKHQIQFAEEALLEIQESFDWYEGRAPDLGERFLTELDKFLDRIDKNPSIYRIIHDGLRQGLLKKFPFVVLYEHEGNRIRIMSVFHTSRDPDKKFHNPET